MSSYLERTAADTPSTGGPYWALVSLRTELGPAATAAALGGHARLARVVLRVPIARVQTAQLTVQLADQGDRAAELTSAMATAASQLQRETDTADGTPGDRVAAVGRVSAIRLREHCACVLALLVRAFPDELRAIAAKSEVRAVDAAPARAGLRALSVTPLLPEQTTAVLPMPDDGGVPPA